METKWQHLPGLSKLKSPRMYLKVLSPKLLFSANSRYSNGSTDFEWLISTESNVLLQVLLAMCI